MRKCAIGFALVALAGCAALPPPPLHAAWYLQYSAFKTPNGAPDAKCVQGAVPSGSKDVKGVFKLYVALLNRSAWDISAAEVIINPSADQAGSAWRWDAAGHSLPTGLRLPIGRLVTLPFDQFAMQAAGSGGDADRNCVLPVEVEVILATDPADPRPWHERWYGRAQGDASGTIRAELAGRMPSSLPDDWTQACQPSRGTTNGR